VSNACYLLEMKVNAVRIWRVVLHTRWVRGKIERRGEGTYMYMMAQSISFAISRLTIQKDRRCSLKDFFDLTFPNGFESGCFPVAEFIIT
jgi:hypothetical protein